MTATPCRSCGAAPAPDARFCQECGARLTARPAAPEYKQVTVLFADVVRSMDIAAAVDPERLREIMTDLVERSATVLRRYGGTVEYNGDGVMALFGAPAALEDHAVRACVAALAIQQEAGRLADDVQHRDGLDLRLRVGVNSGRVIAGAIGSGSLGYAATGEPVGFAKRVESAAPPGGVLLSESTARLVEHTVALAGPEVVTVKGADRPVRVYRLTAIRPRQGDSGRPESTLVGRQQQMATLGALLDRAIGGSGTVASITGPAGVGKSRVAREVAARATVRGMEVVWGFCESHTRDVPFHAVTRMLRAAVGVEHLDDAAARVTAGEILPVDADPDDVMLLHDLLGIADPDAALPEIGPDARRRRITALVTASALLRTDPVLYILEDAHWIDPVSESMLAGFLAVAPRTPSLVLITYRPEYRGALADMAGAETIVLAPLHDSDTTALLGEELGADPSVVELAARIADRAAGNPFFAQEMVRELVQRGVLIGDRGHYRCRADVADVQVPATVQATIAARIDGLSPAAKRTVTAAAVIGDHFGVDLLTALRVDPALDELLDVALIDQVRTIPQPEYAFRHPLIRTVAYESQLRADRAGWHRTLAAAIEDRAPESKDENAALIAEHLQAAGEWHAAYGWHMRAAAWAVNRDAGAARVSWERARLIADDLPGDDPGRLPMRIAPRTMLCVTVGWGRAVHESRARFAELRELCAAAGDKASLAIGMTGLATELLYAGRSREGSRLAAEQMALLESIGDPALTTGLAFIAFANWCDSGEVGELLRWSQVVIDLTGGDPTKGSEFGMGSPLAAALAWRAFAGSWLGRHGWRRDHDDALAIARHSTPDTLAAITAWTYGLSIQYRTLRPDDTALRAIDEAVLAAAEGSNVAVCLATYTKALALLDRDNEDERRHGLQLMEQTRDMFIQERGVFLVPVTDLWIAREWARQGGFEAALPVMRAAVDELQRGQRYGYGVWGTGVLAETLLARAGEDDLREARDAIDWLVNLPADDSVIRELTVLRLRGLLDLACGDEQAGRQLLERHRAIAESLGFEGHLSGTAEDVAELE
ncbi:ATP-binding protein [Mycolicibacterium sp.]|uniref:ATP-binding protein n=1 Tax=Mycolicibacterium sp. TaxID=2320850 RepID=UPI003D0F78D4